MDKKYNGLSNIDIETPENVSYIIDTLTSEGYEAYAVGGCIRDTILGLIPGDWDITTSALPMEIKGLFRRTVDTGIKHGTVSVLIDKESYEVTTYRIDGEYEDNRHPKEVEYTSNLIEDLKRRDFTINSMAYNKEDGLIDPYNGLADLEKRLIKCVGNPKDRFSEDALRTLRAIRFSAQLDFSIENHTKEMICEMAHLINNISKERIQLELDKILVSNNPEKIVAIYETGLSDYILPEFNLMMNTSQNSIYHKYSVGEHTLIVMKNTRNDHYLRWAAFLHDVGKPYTRSKDEGGKHHFKNHDNEGALIASRILKDLRFDNKTVDIVTRLVKYHNIKICLSKDSVRKSIALMGKDIYQYFIELYYADLLAKSDFAIELNMGNYEYIKNTYKEIITDNDPLSLKDLDIKGGDLMDIGISQGKQIGAILDKLFNMVLENPDLNRKDYLIQFVKNNFL